MTTQEVADKLVELCRKGDFETVFKELYSPEVLSIEPEGGVFKTVSKGMEELAEKGKLWHDMILEVHSSEVSDPIVAEDFFACTMKTNVSLKGVPAPVDMDEVCLYHVRDGKVISEQFFYTPVPVGAMS